MNIPIKQWSGADAMEALENTIIAINEANDKQAKRIIRLTYAMLILTFVMACAEKMKETKNTPTIVAPPNPSRSQTVPSHLPKEKNNLPSPQIKSPEKG